MNIYKCAECKNEVEYGAKNCAQCGAKLDWPDEDIDEFEQSDEEEKPVDSFNTDWGLLFVTIFLLVCNPITFGLVFVLIINSIPTEWKFLAWILALVALPIIAVIFHLLASCIKTDTTKNKNSKSKNTPKK